jgi:hypothetical protein
MTTRTEPSTHERPGRSRLLVVAAALIAFSGVLFVVYAPLVVLTPFVDRPTPLLAVLLGVLALLAAAGVWRVQRWGRLLGGGLSAVALGQGLVVIADGILDATGLSIPYYLALSLVWAGLLHALPLWILLRRWPASG